MNNLNLVEQAPRRGELLSTDAVRLAMEVTGGRAFWFLWHAGSGQDLLPSQASLVTRPEHISVSLPGRNIESDADLFRETAERWRETSRPKAPKQRRTPLGNRLDKIRERIKARHQPLLSWEEIDRELAERRGE